MTARKGWPSKEAAAIARAVELLGGSAERTGTQHMKVTGPGGIAFVAVNLGGKGGETLTRVLRTIRRKAGLEVEL